MINAPAAPLLTPKLLASLGDLQLIARRVAESLFEGVQRSRQAGQARDFTSYRPYQPGDNLRQLDWKLYARSDRYYVRESELDRRGVVQLVVDATASMAYAEQGISKWQVAQIAAAALAYVAHAQGDPVGLRVIGDQPGPEISPSREGLILQRIFYQLRQTAPLGKWPPATSVGEGNQLVFLLSDLHQTGDEIRDLAQAYALRRNEVTIIQISAPLEEAFAFNGEVLLEDLESGREIAVNAAQVRTQYLTARAEHRRKFAEEMARLGVRVFPLSLDQPLDVALRTLLRLNTGQRAGSR